jgi:hypothetical protein
MNGALSMTMSLLFMVLVCVFAVIAVLVAFGWFLHYRQLKRLANLRCPSCRTDYGIAAARLAWRAYEEQCRAAERILREPQPIKCETCGCSAKYDLMTKSLVASP